MANPKNQTDLEQEMLNELRKQGINPDMINEYGDVDFEDGVDDYLSYKDSYDEYGQDTYYED
jgi:hypothetical protein